MTQLGSHNVRNRMLLALPEAQLERLIPHLHPVALLQGQSVHEVDRPIQDVHFVNRGFISMVQTMSDGRAVEVGGIGLEGVTAPSSLLGDDRAVFDTMVQVPGDAFRIRRDVLKAEMEASPALARFVADYARFLFGQIGQTAACNRLHSVEERSCRWLLTAEDNALRSRFVLTHEFLAMMLGAQRAGVSIALRSLKHAGLIDTGRGIVDILDRRGLEQTACECYRATRRAIGLLFADANCGDRAGPCLAKPA